MQDESPYYSVDPTPALPASTPTAELKAKLLDESQPMFEVRTCYGHVRHWICRSMLLAQDASVLLSSVMVFVWYCSLLGLLLVLVCLMAELLHTCQQ